MLSFLCRHDFYWSERHRADRCRRCGHLKAGEAASATPVGNLAALLAADDGELEPRFIPTPQPQRDPIFEDWDRIGSGQPVMPTDYAFIPEPHVELVSEAEAEPAPARATGTGPRSFGP